MLIEAPGSSGRTAVVSEFIREYDCDARYVRADSWCRTPNVLAERLLVSLRGAGGGSVQAHTNLGDLQAGIVESLSGPFARPLVLIVDNVETLADSDQAMKLLETIHELMPKHAELILSGRAIASTVLETRARETGGLWLGARSFREADAAKANGQARTSAVRNNALPFDQLSALVRDFSTSRSPEIADQACAQLLERGLVNHAIQLAVTSGSTAATSLVLERVGPQALREASYDTLRALATIARSNDSHSNEFSPLAFAILARIEAATGSPTEALRWTELTRSRGSQETVVRFHALIAETIAARVTADRSRAGEAACELAALAAAGESSEAADAAITAGDFYLYVASDTNKARELYALGLRLASDLGSPALMAHADNKTGDLAYATGDIPSAISHLERAVEGWQRLGKTSRLAATLNNLGLALTSKGDLKEAARAHLDAVDAARSSGADVPLAYSLASLAELEVAHGDPQRAGPYLEEAMHICSNGLVEERLRALVLADLAECSLRTGAFAQARSRATRAELIAQSSAGPLEQATCSVTLARINLADGMTTDGVARLQTAADTFEAAGAVGDFLTAELELASSHYRNGQTKHARSCLKIAAKAAKGGHHQGTIMATLRSYPDFAQWVKAERSAKGLLAEAEWARLVRPDIFREQSSPSNGTEVRYDSRTGKVFGTAGEVGTSTWSSPASQRLFELFLSNRDGIAVDAVKELMDPSDPVHRGNSSMQSAIHGVDAALYEGAVVERDGRLMIDPRLRVRVAA